MPVKKRSGGEDFPSKYMAYCKEKGCKWKIDAATKADAELSLALHYKAVHPDKKDYKR